MTASQTNPIPQQQRLRDRPPELFACTRCKLIVIFAILAVGLLAAGYLSYWGYERHYRIDVERQLSAIADLKVAELVKWRKERLGDAEILYNNTQFSNLVTRYYKNPGDRELEEQLQVWFNHYSKYYDYSQIRLLDREGVTRLSFPPGRPPASVAVLNKVAEAVQSGRITIVDLYRHDYDQRIYLTILIPILDRSAGNQVIGLVALRVDPQKYLYPSILHWPTPSETGETLLVRRDGNEVLYLADCCKKDTALKLRYPLDRTDMPPVMAVLGRTGIVEGVDYCGKEAMIADLRVVPDSPWFLVTRMNTSEVYAGVRGHFWLIAGLVTALLFGAGAALAFVWRQQVEESLRQAHDELEQKVQERTLELQKTHAQLLHAEKLSAIGSLSASIAHEFNNPLQGVMSVIKGVRKREHLEEKNAQLMDMAVTECNRMRDMVKSLQDFNRPTSGRFAPMDIHAAIDSILLLSKKDFVTRGITVERDYAANLPQVEAVADQIKQVLLNLLNNGADACENGGTIKIRTETHPENIIIRIQDSGTGIHPEVMNHIFEPFFTTKPAVKGTGLGLSVSYGIIKKHGGLIEVESEPGKGSTFSVILPIKGGQDQAS